MFRFSHVALLAALGCSPVKDFSNIPDAPVDAPDMRPAEIVSATPENGAMKISILTPISVVFDEPLDPASVDATTVKLSYRTWLPPFYPDAWFQNNHGPGQAGATFVKGTVSYDETAREVSFIPAAPLPYGTTLTLSLDVKDRAGLATTASVTFTTYVNGNTNQFAYNDQTGAPISWTGQPTDMNGRPTKLISGSQPGADMIWFTADDPRKLHYAYSYSPDGRLLNERHFDRGQDNQYDTADDVVKQCLIRTYSAQNALTEIRLATNGGPDNMWCTDDDPPSQLMTVKYTADRLDGFVYYTNPGTDMMWRTADDRCDLHWDYANDDRGNRVREVWMSCGTDGLPQTADDTHREYYEYEYDADGNVTRETRKTGPGADKQWLTEDDVIYRVIRHLRDADGQVTETITTFSPGPDMVWGTADDDRGHRVVFTYDARKLMEEVTVYNSFGNDRMWGTVDDEISSYSKLTYDTNGNRTHRKDYTSGPDGMWKNEDDLVTREYRFDLDR